MSLVKKNTGNKHSSVRRTKLSLIVIEIITHTLFNANFLKFMVAVQRWFALCQPLEAAGIKSRLELEIESRYFDYFEKY